MTDLDADEYSERADFLDSTTLSLWTVDHPHFSRMQKKITQSGAKLLVGPRGCGKTHHLRYAHAVCSKSGNRPLPVYVSFTRYYYLEPYLRQSRQALQVFHSWVLAKILASVAEDYPDSFTEFAADAGILDANALNDFIKKAERGIDPESLNPKAEHLSVRDVVNCVEHLLVRMRRKRAIVMLDDAALVLTPEYMTEFFDIFRSIKTAKVSPKASVYPGTTEYGPRFHADHDAEKVQAWLDVDSPGYPGFMERIARDRLEVGNSEIGDEVLRSIAYAAFGMPRAFITMCRRYIEQEGAGSQARFNSIITEHVEFRRNEYLSLGDKTPQYRDIIDVGWKLFQAIVEEAVSENQKASEGERCTQVGLVRNFDRKSERMVRFLTEAGLLYELQPVSHGPGRDYARFVPHYAFLIERRAFSKGRGWSARKMNASIEAKEKKHPIRRRLEGLLEPSDIARIELNLPACQECGEERLAAHQSYCHACGSKLIEPSIFDQCQNKSIDDLPITQKKKDRLKKEANIETIGDIIYSDDPASELRKARSVGKEWANHIYRLAKSVEEEYFS